MDKTKLIDIALVEWIANFRSSGKKTKEARGRFEELFQRWKDLDATFDDLYETYLPKAIKAHQPAPAVIRNVYKLMQSRVNKSEKEFTEEWNDTIEAVGQEVFFEFFPATPVDHDPEPKVYGNMSRTEYIAQRKYADQFPTLNTTELVRAWKEQQEYNLDVEGILENVLGGNNHENDK